MAKKLVTWLFDAGSNCRAIPESENPDRKNFVLKTIPTSDWDVYVYSEEQFNALPVNSGIWINNRRQFGKGSYFDVGVAWSAFDPDTVDFAVRIDNRPDGKVQIYDSAASSKIIYETLNNNFEWNAWWITFQRVHYTDRVNGVLPPEEDNGTRFVELWKINLDENDIEIKRELAHEFEYDGVLPLRLWHHVYAEDTVGQYILIDLDGLEEVITAPVDYGLSNTSNDVYNKSRMVERLLDIDEIIYRSGEFDFQMIPTRFDPNLGEYINYEDIVDENGNISTKTYDPMPFYNSTAFKEMALKQFLPEYENFFIGIDSTNLVTRSYLDNLESILLKKATFMNFFKGNQTQMRFLISIFAESIGKHLISVDPSPYWNFVYMVSTDMDKEYWTKDIKPITHPIGWGDYYAYIPPQEPNYLQVRRWTIEDFLLKYKDCLDYLTFSYQGYKRFTFFANVEDRALTSFHKFDFVKAGDAQFSRNYDDSSLIAEVVPAERITVVERKEDRKHTFVVEYEETGVGTEYVWNVKRYGNTAFVGRTTMPKFEFGSDDDATHEVELTLVNENWQHTLPSRSVEPYSLARVLLAEDAVDDSSKYIDETGGVGHDLFRTLPWDDFAKFDVLREGSYEYEANVNLVAAQTELSDPALGDVVLKSVSGKTVAELSFGLSGVALEYIWVVYRDGVRINILKSWNNAIEIGVPSSTVGRNTAGLVLKNGDWQFVYPHTFSF